MIYLVGNFLFVWCLEQPAKQYVRVHKDGNQEDPVTFAVILDDKGLFSPDKDDEPAIVANLSAVNQEPQNVRDQRSDDIANLQAPMTQVLVILSDQQVNQQVQAKHIGLAHLALADHKT